MNVNIAGGGATIHFSLQGKGGVGKSVMASWLAQYFQSKDIPVICIDTDPVNATLSQFKDLHADHLNVLKAGTINEKQFDALVERGRGVFVHLVVTGGQAMPDTLAGFKQVAETAPANSIIMWLNEYFGEIERYGKRFEDLQVAQQFASRPAGAVRIRERNRHTFGDDVKMMLERYLTFEGAIGSDEFGLVSKQRLAQVRRDLFEQLDNLRLVLWMRTMTASDIKTLIGEVAARHGVTLRPDDPAFVGFVIGPCRLSLMEVHVSPNTWVLPFRKCEVSDAGCAVLGH